MNTATHISSASGLRRVLRALLVLAAFSPFLLGTACQKKCQQPNQTPFKSLRETPWRLIDTNNPAAEYRNLSRFTFLIMDFAVNFKGDVKKVVNNDQYDTPILTFIYNVDPDNKFLVVQYSALTAGDGSGDGSGGGGDASGGSTDVGTVKYNYQLSNKLTLYEIGRPYYYEYVPFVGVVDPDSTCVF